MSSFKKSSQLILTLVITLAVFLGQGSFSFPVLAATPGSDSQPLMEADGNSLQVSISPALVREGNDFATQVLLDPWDMNEFSDISRYLNESNVAQHLSNFQVANGIFSAHTASNDPQFYTLFPGYRSSLDSINIPVKSGARFPISSSNYHCFYTRMQVGTTDPTDDARVFWFENNYLALGNFGVTGRIQLHDQNWHLYKIDLNTNFDAQNANTRWASLPTWQGLRIDPTKHSDVNFQVDWVRLTDCAAVNTNLTWQPTSSSVEIWAGTGNAQPAFPVDTVDGSSGHYTLDVQGWQPGTYYIGLKNAAGNFSWGSTPLVIKPAPLIQFNSPSFESGDQITWNMNSISDINTNPFVGTRCVNYSFDNGMLNLLTKPPQNQPADCRISLAGMLTSDPQVVLNVPVSQIDTTQYRYLTLHTHMDGMVQDINHGWVFRWLWKTYNNNDPNKWCIDVSNDIVFDPGWQTIVVDLLDPVDGVVEDMAGPYCPSSPMSWSDKPTDWLRVDINENATSSSFNQIIDSIVLSKVDQVRRGTNYAVRLDSNVPLSNLDITLYYTTNRNQPRQQVAQIPAPATPPNFTGAYSVYLPFALDASQDGPSSTAEASMYWATGGVAPGSYYLCLEASDGLNSTMQCSLAPIVVY